jgi:hypothetical protein
LVIRLFLVVVGIIWVIIAIAFLSGLVDSGGPAEEWMIGTGVGIGFVGLFFAVPGAVAGGFMLAAGAVVASTYGAGWVLAGGVAMALLGFSRYSDWEPGDR